MVGLLLYKVNSMKTNLCVSHRKVWDDISLIILACKSFILAHNLDNSVRDLCGTKDVIVLRSLLLLAFYSLPHISGLKITTRSWLKHVHSLIKMSEGFECVWFTPSSISWKKMLTLQKLCQKKTQKNLVNLEF